MTSELSDETRFAGWLEQHDAIPRKLARAYAFETVDEAELHQEMLVQLWRSLPQFRGQAKASTWIYRVCLNTAMTWRRSEQRRTARVVADQAPVDDAVATESGPADIHERNEQLAALMAAVRALPSAERSLIVLALDGLSHREIGEVTGLTENHVGVALLRARRKLSELLKEVSDEL